MHSIDIGINSKQKVSGASSCSTQLRSTPWNGVGTRLTHDHVCPHMNVVCNYAMLVALQVK